MDGRLYLAPFLTVVMTYMDFSTSLQVLPSPSPFPPPAGYTPMHLAVLCGNVQTMKLLHAAGADINAAVSRWVWPGAMGVWACSHVVSPCQLFVLVNLGQQEWAESTALCLREGRIGAGWVSHCSG